MQRFKPLSHQPASVAAALEQLPVRPLLEDRRGAAVMMVALMAPVMMGMTALAVDVGMWRLEKVRLQLAVDSAALAAAHARLAGAEGESLRGVAAHELARNGFDPDQPGNDFNLVLRQRDGSVGVDDVEVTATTEGGLYFGRFLSSEPPTIEAAAVGGVDAGNLGRICVLGLEENAPSTVQFRGNPDIDLNCTVVSNSKDYLSSMEIAGNSTIAAAALIASGGIDIKGTPISRRRGHDGRSPGCRSPIRSAPRAATCRRRRRHLRHNGELHVQNNTGAHPGPLLRRHPRERRHRNLQPRLYVIHNGNLTTVRPGEARRHGRHLRAHRLVGQPDRQHGLRRRHPSRPERAECRHPWAEALGYAGILFYQDQNAASKLSSNGDNKLLGGTIARLDGTAYFPRQTLMYTGGAELKDGCLMLVARQVLFRGNAEFVQLDNSCDTLGVEALRLPSVKLLG
jgi:hypothetical protein